MENEMINTSEEVMVAEAVESTQPTQKEKRKYFARTGWKIALVGLLIQLVELAIVFLITKVFKVDISKNLWVQFPVIFVAVNCIGFPLFYLLTLKSEKSAPEKKKLKFGWLIIIVFICYTFTVAGNLIGMGVNSAILLPFGINPAAGNALSQIMTGDSALNLIFSIIVAGIGAPIFEELIFRKLFLDHTLKYGAGAAILLSGLFFGLYHGNFGQFFYAFALGIIFAYVYSYTGNIKYTIFLHMSINLYSSLIIMPALSMIDHKFLAELMKVVEIMQSGDFQGYMDAAVPLIQSNPTALLGIYIFAFAVMFEYTMVFAGFILALCFIKRFIRIRKSMNMGGKGTKVAAVFNWGSLLMVLLGVAMFIYYYAQIILPVVLANSAK